MSAGIVRRTLLAGAGVIALVLAVSGVAIAAANPHHADVSGTEHFQLISASETANTGPVIVYGSMFTGHGTDHMGRSVDTFQFANGSFKVTHSPGKGPHSFNRKTCLFMASQHGTYTIGHGTGAYKGIRGNGRYKLSFVGLGARSGGKCSQKRAPVAFQLVIMASGPVHL
jgi:hypothetical protein